MKGSIGRLFSRRRIAAVLAWMLALQLVLSGYSSGSRVAGAEPEKPVKYITFLYTDFVQASNRLVFNGSSSYVGSGGDSGNLRLTPNQGDKYGTVFNKEKVSLRAGTGFSTYFTFKMTSPGGTTGTPPGADGIVFALQTRSNSAGSLGGGMGFENITNSVGIEFDTFNNGSSQWGNNGDPSDNHVAVDFNGVVTHGKNGNPAAVNVTGIDFNSGSDVHAWIDYSTVEQKLYVYLSSNANRPTTPTLTQSNVNLQSYLGAEEIYAGFTAATGSAWQNHDIEQWYFTNKYDPIDLNSATYVEAPSIFSVTSAVYEPPVPPSVEGAVYRKADVRLVDSKGNPGPDLNLIVEKEDNVTFLDPDNDLAPLDTAPSLATDSNGQATYYYMATDIAQAVPSFRISTEYGAYYDLKITVAPTVETGEPIPQYIADNPTDQRAVIPVQVVNTGGENTIWGVDYREKTDDDSNVWIPYSGTVPKAVLDTSGTYNVTLQGLKEDTYYEVRAYAINSKGEDKGEAKTFAVQMPMPKEQLTYLNAGPSKIYRDDAEYATVVGQNLYWLLKRLPHTDLSVKLTGEDNTEYVIPRSDIQSPTNNSLKIKLPTISGEKLPLGKYDISIGHEYFDSKLFENAIELTDDPAYRSINYEVVTVENPKVRPDPNDVEEIELRGPFVVNASEPNIYRLRDTNSVVTLNDNLLFKGTDLTVDKSTGEITGNGRFYVNGKNTIPLLSTYTVYEGQFSFTPATFRFTLNGGLAGAASDLTGLNMPVSVNSFTFIKGGIRISGSANLGFKAAGTTIGASADVEALEFKQNRFDLAAKFEVPAEFKSGPLESAALRFSIDTRVPQFGVGASAELKKAKIGFDIDLLIVDKKLDSISFAVQKEMKLGSTGAQLTKLGGGVSNMTALSQAPLTFSVLAGMSDYITPKLAGTYMVNGNDLKVSLSANHFEASGKLAIYKINIAGVNMFVVFNPTGYKGYNRAGFDFDAQINIIDIIVGQVAASYFQGSSFAGYAKAAVQIPGSVPLVGGYKLTSAEVGVDSSRFKGALSVIGIGFTVKYPFSTKSFDWDVDLSSTIKNVANAVVNTAKSIYNTVSSWFWYTDPNTAGEWTAADTGDIPGVTGEKLFSASDIRSTAFGTYNAAKLATVVAETNPSVEKSGGKLVHSFAVDKAYSGLIAIEGEQANLSLTRPNGAPYEIVFESEDEAKINAYYDESADKTVVAVDLTPGTWKLSSANSLSLAIHKVLFRHSSLSLADAAELLDGSDVQSMIPVTFAKRGKYLVELEETVADALLLKSDGRPYATEASSASEAYNTQWVAEDGKLYLLVEAPEAGTWYAIAGAEAHANLYRMASDASMSEALAWIEGSEFVSAANFTGLKGSRVLLEIQGASTETKLYRPDGTEYPLVTDSSDEDWNAVFDASQGVIRALVDVDQEGVWLVKSNGFTDSFGLTLSGRMTMEELTDETSTITYSLRIGEKGKYLFDIAGGDASTKIYGINGQEVAVITDENAANRNAIVDAEGLMVTVDASAAGTIKIKTKLNASIKQYLLTPIPEVTKLKASAQLARNTYEVEWKVENAKQDTKVSLILANGDKDEEGKIVPVGDVLASDLPATGIRTVTLPEGYLPGDYYLAVVADSESYGPIYKTLNDPLTYQAVKMQPKPTSVQATAIGNGEVRISFTDPGYAETTSYRIYPADVNGNVDFNGTSYEGEVASGNGANQTIVLSGIETGVDYRFRVMAIKAEYGTIAGVNDDTLINLYVSELSDPASVTLPVPNPAKLTVSYLDDGDSVPLQTYYPYNVTDETLAGLTAEEKQALQHTLAVTSASDVVLKAQSDQNATIKLYVDGDEVAASGGTPGEFHLGELSEKAYTIEVEAVNSAGDVSYSYGRLVVDRTAPYLYLKTAVNGQVIEGDRVKLEGVSEAGVTLTINDTVVPVDAMGHYIYYAAIPATGSLPIEMIAIDQAGNETIHRLEVFSSGEAVAGETAVDLGALGTDDGIFTSTFESSVADYELGLDVRTKQLRVWAVPVDPEATVTIAGQAADEQFSAQVPVTLGMTIPIVVTGADGIATKSYSIEVKSESDLASLSGLELEGILSDNTASEESVELSRSFNGSVDSYDVAVSSDIESVKVTPTVAAAGSLIRVGEAVVASGQASAAIPIATSEAGTTITVDVLSLNEASAATPDWTLATTYTLHVTRAASSDASLAQLQLSGISMTPSVFDSEVFEYNARVGASVESVQLNYAAADSDAAVTLNGDNVSSSGTSSLVLNQGTNRFALNVQAKDGSEQTYQIVIYKDKEFSQALLLSDLSVDGLELTREFAPLVRNYAVTKETLGSSVKITAVANVEGATVKVNGVVVDDNDIALANLNVGDNSVLIQVESPDKSETNLYSIGITRSFVGGGSSSETFNVKVNNGDNDKIAKGVKTEENGKTILKVTFLADETKKLLESEGANPVITIDAGMTPDRMTTELTADLVEKMKEKDAILFFDAGGSTYRLPTSAIDLTQIRNTFSSGSLEDIVVKVDIRLVGEDESQSIAKQAAASGAAVIGTPVEFTITYTYNGRTIEADRFSEYVQRSIALPEGTAASQITTGVRIAEDGTLQHIPTVVTRVGDREFAVMNSFTNSVYTLISNKATFPDIAGKWSQDAIENLASRKILAGQGDGTFAPTRGVTRAEFAAMIVRALGLPTQADGSFSDVKTKDWYASSVASAKAYGLINGYTDGTFRPQQTITRAEAVAILNKAWVLVGKSAISESDSALTLEKVVDQADIPTWSRAAIGSALQLGLLTGYVDGSVKPLRTVTREETAAMLQNLLIRSDLIDSN
ncbi:cadherin-like beta sandwich domain-containing protein [Cohnella fermenti]|uniref:Uncharacterized protein n=1 Tax=Cohnella fermenti TaxID=2565925 RepID=A0A4S4BH16_9BACL|nr:cadherin-like beta sandwich domain-containing protein [Cohnella fermenti]THF73766.1 hypothetical protein E6C55_27630 [Cohnella fermenti]